MITGLHALIYCKNPKKVRAFFRDVLGYPYVDAGDGWLIFSMPPAELGVHPAEENGVHEIYLLCDDLDATMGDLRRKGVRFSPARETGFGYTTSIKLPGGGELGLYEPKHKSALEKNGTADSEPGRRRHA
jgi:catechol 2,3-dioxygenase-like lactoylglutathione lyase family enzyme